MLLPLLSLLSLPPHRCSCLPPQPHCNNCHCHGRCLFCYRHRLPHFVDSCLPPQFLLLSATAIATVAPAATADPVSAAVAAAICPHCRRHCPCRLCTCPLCCPLALSPLPLPTSLPSPLLAHVSQTQKEFWDCSSIWCYFCTSLMCIFLQAKKFK